MWSVGNMWHWSPRQILRLSHFLFIISLIIIFFFSYVSVFLSHNLFCPNLIIIVIIIIFIFIIYLSVSHHLSYYYMSFLSFFFFSKNVIHLVEDVAEAASRALWRKNLGSSSHQGTMRFYNNDGLENHIIETLQQDLQEDADLYADLNAAVRTIPTTLSRKRTIKYVPSFSSPALPSFYFCFTTFKTYKSKLQVIKG